MSAIRVSAARLYEVYRYHQRSTTQPSQLIDAVTASYWLDCGFATRVGRWRIRLLKESPLKLRDQSASPSAATSIAAIAGSKYHQAIVEAWR